MDKIYQILSKSIHMNSFCKTAFAGELVCRAHHWVDFLRICIYPCLQDWPTLQLSTRNFSTCVDNLNSVFKWNLEITEAKWVLVAIHDLLFDKLSEDICYVVADVGFNLVNVVDIVMDDYVRRNILLNLDCERFSFRDVHFKKSMRCAQCF